MKFLIIILLLIAPMSFSQSDLYICSNEGQIALGGLTKATETTYQYIDPTTYASDTSNDKCSDIESDLNTFTQIDFSNEPIIQLCTENRFNVLCIDSGESSELDAEKKNFLLKTDYTEAPLSLYIVEIPNGIEKIEYRNINTGYSELNEKQVIGIEDQVYFRITPSISENPDSTTFRIAYMISDSINIETEPMHKTYVTEFDLDLNNVIVKIDGENTGNVYTLDLLKIGNTKSLKLSFEGGTGNIKYCIEDRNEILTVGTWPKCDNPLQIKTQNNLNLKFNPTTSENNIKLFTIRIAEKNIINSIPIEVHADSILDNKNRDDAIIASVIQNSSNSNDNINIETKTLQEVENVKTEGRIIKISEDKNILLDFIGYVISLPLNIIEYLTNSIKI